MLLEIRWWQCDVIHRELIWYDTQLGLVGSCQVSLDGFASETSRSPVVRVELLLNTEELIIFLTQIRVWPTVGEVWRLRPCRVMIDHAPEHHVRVKAAKIWRQNQYRIFIVTSWRTGGVGREIFLWRIYNCVRIDHRAFVNNTNRWRFCRIRGFL